MKKIFINLMTYDWISMPVLFVNVLRVFFIKEWDREVVLSNLLAKFFSVNDGSTFEMKGLYILGLILLGLYTLTAVPFVFWLYLMSLFAIVLFLTAGIMFVRIFIHKKEWTRSEHKDGQG